MNILTFDTSLDKTYVTLSCNEDIVSSEIIENHNEKYHSAYLIPTIVSVLKNNKLKMQDINAIGTNIGPGSFTGIRACVTVARVFAQQLEIPLVGVSSLEILSKINSSDKNSIVVLDARKNQFYTAIYDSDGKELQQPKLVSKEDMLLMAFSDSFVITDPVSKKILEENGFVSYCYIDEKPELGLFLNELVQNKLNSFEKDTFLWGKLKPLYLQAPPVTISVKNKA